MASIFFVLSGFLITGILIDTKGRPTFYRKFYIRRALRILPAYLLLVLFLVFTGWLTFGSAAVALLFLTNYSLLFTLFHLGGYGPLWSLSVEEQFYLVWPSVVGRVSVRILTYISIALCLVEPFLRWLVASGHLHLGDLSQATYLIADNLALGALAAIFARSSYGTLRNGVRIGLGLCLAGLAIFAAGYPFGIMHRTNVVGNTLQSVPWNIFFAGTLLLCLGLRSPLASSLWAAPLRFFGYISYGLYLVHFLIFVRYDDKVTRISDPSLRHLLEGAFTRFFLAGGLSILIAWLSRRLYEERFLLMGRSAPVENEDPLVLSFTQEDRVPDSSPATESPLSN
ncbi:acyltransferase family protein [Tunturiibacter gelidiferens]|uniref:acyltransferase family protein n=1 Tax=Tunturiibacter gelidiferens TaxID=3069689 RepID=UPI003D9B9BB5